MNLNCQLAHWTHINDQCSMITYFRAKVDRFATLLINQNLDNCDVQG